MGTGDAEMCTSRGKGKKSKLSASQKQLGTFPGVILVSMLNRKVATNWVPC